MPLFKTMSPASRAFKRSSRADQLRTSALILLAKYLPIAARREVIPQLEAAAGLRSGHLSKEGNARLTREISLALVRSFDIPPDENVRRLWGRNTEAFRELLATLVLSEAGDPRQALENVDYSSNPLTALAQIVALAHNLFKLQGNDVFPRYSVVAPKWRQLVNSAVASSFTVIKRDPEHSISETRQCLRELSTRGQGVVVEFLARAQRSSDSFDVLPPINTQGAGSPVQHFKDGCFSGLMRLEEIVAREFMNFLNRSGLSDLSGDSRTV